MFRRYSSQLSQANPAPSRNYPSNIFDQFVSLINLKVMDKDGNIDLEKVKQIKLLLKCYIVTLFIPGIPKAALMLHGEQGAAKTTGQELIKKLVDPSGILTLTFPRDINELILQLSHNYIAFYDNSSVIRPWVSDQLCRAVTGSGFSKRKLYTDEDDIICHFMRGIGFNGINLAATKADLLDRGIIIELAYISEKDRRLLRDIWADFERIRPQLISYIFDILVKVLKFKKDNGGIKLESRSRLADFEEYGEIISRCMGNDDGEFIRAYQENRKLQTDAALEARPIAIAITALMDELAEEKQKYEWEGTATALLTDLETIGIKLKIKIEDKELWPKNANILSRRLNEVKTNLRSVGIYIDTTKHPKTRLKTIHIRKENTMKRIISSEPSESSGDQNSPPNGAKPSNDTTDGNKRVSSDKALDPEHENQGSDDTNDTNGIIRSSISQQQLERDGFFCKYCNILNNSNVTFTSSDLYIRHVVKRHKDWTAYPGPADIQKFEWEQKEIQQKEDRLS